MTAGEVAAIVAAAALVGLVCLLAYPIVKLGKALDETRALLSDLADRGGPMLDEVTATATAARSQLARMETITTSAEVLTANAAAASSLFATTVGAPLVRAASFSSGVRRALSGGARREVTEAMRAERQARRAGGRRLRRPGRRDRAALPAG